MALLPPPLPPLPVPRPPFPPRAFSGGLRLACEGLPPFQPLGHSSIHHGLVVVWWLAVLGKRSFLLLELSAYGTCLSPSTTTFSTHTFFFSFVTGSSFSPHSPFTHSALGGRGVACEHRY